MSKSAPQHDRKTSLKRRNRATLLIIVAFVALVYFVNMVKLHAL